MRVSSERASSRVQPPQSNIVRDHPRTFIIGTSAAALAGASPILALCLLPIFGYAFMCWIDEDRFRAAHEQAWKRFYADLHEQVKRLNG